MLPTVGAYGPAVEAQDVVPSLETRLASIRGGPERCSFERALASAAISIAPVAGDLDTVVGVGGRYLFEPSWWRFALVAGRAGQRWWRQQLAASRAGLLCFAQRTQPPGCGAVGQRPGPLPGRLCLAGTGPGGRWRAGGCRGCWWRPELAGGFPVTVSPGSGAIAR